MADEWWGRQKGLRQTLRTEVAVGGKGPDAQLDQWAITIRFEDENSSSNDELLRPFVIEGCCGSGSGLTHWRPRLSHRGARLSISQSARYSAA